MTKRMIAIFVAVFTMLAVCTAFAAGWAKDRDGNIYYVTENNGLCMGLAVIGDKTYFFDQKGRLVTGWFEIREKDVVPEEGAKLVGWHFAGPDGEIIYGFARINGQVYYFDDNGTSVTGSVVVNDAVYTFDASGVIISGNINNIDIPEYAVTREGFIVTLHNSYPNLSPVTSPNP